MTELLTRPPAAATSTATESTGSGSVWWRGCLAALWAVAVGIAILIVVVLVVWATDARSGAGAGGAIRFALQLWLVAHKVPLHVSGATVAVAPLGLTLALAFVVARAAAVLARGHDVDDVSGILTVGTAVGVPYAVLAAFVAAAATAAPVRPSPVAALGAGLVVGWLAATWGAARGTIGVTALVRSLPGGAGRPITAGAIVVGILFAGGLLLDIASLAVHARTAAELADSLSGGFVATVALLVADALLVPNAAITTIGYLTGPGFAVGTGTSVSLAGSHLGAVPALPLLGALPHGAAPIVVRLFAIVLLLAAGAVASWWVIRDGELSASVILGRVFGTAAAAGVITAVLVAIAGGPAGPGRMAAVGASAWQVGLVLAGETAFVATLVALPLAWRRS
jgi:hypothetical protein